MEEKELQEKQVTEEQKDEPVQDPLYKDKKQKQKISMEEKTVEIDNKFKAALEKAREFNEAFNEFRDIEIPEITLLTDTEEKQKIAALGNEINGRSAYILRAILVHHGNLLFM